MVNKDTKANECRGGASVYMRCAAGTIPGRLTMIEDEKKHRIRRNTPERASSRYAGPDYMPLRILILQHP